MAFKLVERKTKTPKSWKKLGITTSTFDILEDGKVFKKSVKEADGRFEVNRLNKRKKFWK
ncbi:MAG: hypothetical protein KAU95_02045 [Candidatus Aenigmarchaeota archaeon]|nr:hypothetical protein [Candidatus Aenigmarchaeota archaeon]